MEIANCHLSDKLGGTIQNRFPTHSFAKSETPEADTSRRTEEPCKLNADPNNPDDQGGDGAALYPHGQPANKKKVQYGIQNAAQNADQHTDLRFSVHTEKHSQYRTNHHQGIGEQHNTVSTSSPPIGNLSFIIPLFIGLSNLFKLHPFFLHVLTLVSGIFILCGELSI